MSKIASGVGCGGAGAASRGPVGPRGVAGRVGCELGGRATVVPGALPHVWWAVPVLVLSAAQNALLEELVVVGYLLTRLRELGWRVWIAVATSATLRGAYHLYQGFGAFVGNALMG